MNNIIITGSTGFIGSYITEFLEKKYTCLEISKKKGVDILNFSDLQKLDFEADTIIHAAASMSNDFEDSFYTNVIGTLNICKYAKSKKISNIIFISSISIFDNIENEYFNNYGKSKKQAEEVAQSFCVENGIGLTVLRLSQVYDTKRIAYKSQTMLYTFIDSIKKKKKLSIYGKKNPLRNYIHIEDVLYLIEDVIKNHKNGIFNFVNTKSHTISEIAYMIYDVLGEKPNIEYLEDKDDILSTYIPKNNLYFINKNFKDLQTGILEIISNEK